MASARVRYLTVELGQDQDFHLCTLRDSQQFADDDGIAERLGISSATWPLFGVLWPAGILLAEIVVELAVGKRRILEVGCGMALASIVLQGRQANVTATDNHPEAARFLEDNSHLNQVAPVPFVRADWDGSGDALGRFDMIIGSDLLYDPHIVTPLVDFLLAHAARRCDILIVDPRRGLSGRFTRQMQGHGFRVNSSNRDYGPPQEPPHTFVIMNFTRG